MTRQSAIGTLAGWLRSPNDTWVSLEHYTSTAFTLAGLALLGSLLVPAGLSLLTNWAWVAGLFLVGVGVLAAVGGLLGIYVGVAERAWMSARVGVVGGVVAGIAALALLAMAGFALIRGVILGGELGKPIGVFSAVGISMASGLTLGYIALGLAGWWAGDAYATPGQLLVLGGLLLLIPTGGELLRFAIAMQQPAWVFLAALVMFSVDTLAVGHTTRSLGSS